MYILYIYICISFLFSKIRRWLLFSKALCLSWGQEVRAWFLSSICLSYHWGQLLISVKILINKTNLRQKCFSHTFHAPFHLLSLLLISLSPHYLWPLSHSPEVSLSFKPHNLYLLTFFTISVCFDFHFENSLMPLRSLGAKGTWLYTNYATFPKGTGHR